MNNSTTLFDSFSWPALGAWLINKGLVILFVVLVAILVRHFSRAAITRITRRAVRNRRFSHVEFTPEDIRKRQDTLIELCTAIVNVAIWVVAAGVIVAQIAPFDPTPLFASAGIIGIALGFGAQTIIKDFLTGIFIISENQYRVGDVVEIDVGNGASGTVEKVTVRSTVLRDADGNVHYVPNGNITHVINNTMGFSRINLTITVEPDTDIDKIAEVINKIGETMANDEDWKERILTPPHFLNIGGLTDRSLEVEITGKTQPSEQWSVTGELRRRLLASFKKHHISLAHVPLELARAPKPKKRN